MGSPVSQAPSPVVRGAEKERFGMSRSLPGVLSGGGPCRGPSVAAVSLELLLP